MDQDPRSINPQTQRPYHDVELPEGWIFRGYPSSLYAFGPGDELVHVSRGLAGNVRISAFGPAGALFQALRALLREAKRRGWDVGEVEL